MSDELFYQCRLSKGSTRDQAYIPARGATVNAKVEIPPGSGEFWNVDAVGNHPITKSELRGLQANAKDHRKATDV